MTGADTYVVLAVGIVFGWCLHEGLDLVKRPKTPSKRETWRTRHAEHVATTRKLKRFQITGGKPAA